MSARKSMIPKKSAPGLDPAVGTGFPEKIVLEPE
jgi:hypothetical protein